MQSKNNPEKVGICKMSGLAGAQGCSGQGVSFQERIDAVPLQS